MLKLGKWILPLAAVSLLFSCKNSTEMQNPLLGEFDTPHQTAPFDKITNADYKPAFEAAMAEGRKEIDAIANNSEAPSFSNTIEAMDKSGALLDQVSNIFFNLNSAETNDEMQVIAREISPLLSDYGNDIMLNEALFARVKKVYDARETLNLNPEQKMLLEDTYRGFVRSGANLKGAQRERFREISREMSQLTLQFGENSLKETNAFMMHITNKEELAGLPESALEAAAQAAKAKNLEGWIFTLQYPSFGPFMKYGENRALREKLYRAYTSRGCQGNENDNRELIKKIVSLRLEKAKLFGYNNYAEFVLVERMAEKPEKVNAFLEDLLTASLPYAQDEFAELQAYAKKQGADFELMPWDWGYYSNKLKTEKYSVNDELVKPYFELDKVKAGIFDLAHSLYGITYTERTDIPKYHADVTTYEVKDENGKYLGVLYLDFFPRDGKRSGAWMTSFKSQYMENGTDNRPHVTIVCNFTKPTETKPSLLTFGEVTTFLHEFGHGLHGMLTRCTYKSLSGTSVARDFVELPSQFMENFATEKEWLDKVAVHYQTGEKMPEELLQKIIDSRNFQSGYASIRQLSFGMMDMAWHSMNEPFIGDVVAFEKNAISRTSLFAPVEGSCSSAAFGHIFAGGYAAGYYGYKWAEVLDADAFAAFKEVGIFNHDIAAKFRKEILERGGTRKEMESYVAFRGQEPGVEALLKRSGLIK